MISSTLQSRILQNISIVCVLTLSFLFNRVICPGLTLYRFISVYWEMPFTFIISQRFSNEITINPPFLLDMITEYGV